MAIDVEARRALARRRREDRERFRTSGADVLDTETILKVGENQQSRGAEPNELATTARDIAGSGADRLLDIANRGRETRIRERRGVSSPDLMGAAKRLAGGAKSAVGDAVGPVARKVVDTAGPPIAGSFRAATENVSADQVLTAGGARRGPGLRGVGAARAAGGAGGANGA